MRNQMNLVIFTYFLHDERIITKNGVVEVSEDKFIAIGIEKSKPSDNCEYSDLLNIIVLVKGKDGKYYINKIENHPEYILTPRYANDDRFAYFVEELEFAENQLIGDIYTFNDSREQCTLTIRDEKDDATNREKAYQVYEKYCGAKISVGYEIWDDKDGFIKAGYKLWVRCQLGRGISAIDSPLEDLENKIVQYQIWIWDLLNVSVFRFPYFEPWQGKVSIDGINVTLEE